jgi:hypothetical protein
MREIATTPAQNQPPDKGLDVLSAFIGGRIFFVATGL